MIFIAKLVMGRGQKFLTPGWVESAIYDLDLDLENFQ